MSSVIRSAWSFGVLVVFACAVSAQQPSRDASSVTTGTGVISGTVVTTEPSPHPIRRAIVSLNSSTGTMFQLTETSVTDDAGRFVFSRLPAGTYSARVTKTGFVSWTYGEKRSGGIGTPVTLTEGQRVTIAMKMLRGAVITGTLFDQNGRPMAQTSVRASPMRVVNGQRTAAPDIGGSATSDDRGVYRMYGLAPGDYLVSASPRLASNSDLRPITEEEIRWGQQQLQPGASFGAGAGATATPPPKPAQPIGYTIVHYPGTTDVAAA